MCVQPSLVQALFTVSVPGDDQAQMCFLWSSGLEFPQSSKTSIQSTHSSIKNKQQLMAQCPLDQDRTKKLFSTLHAPQRAQ